MTENALAILNVDGETSITLYELKLGEKKAPTDSQTSFQSSTLMTFSLPTSASRPSLTRSETQV